MGKNSFILFHTYYDILSPLTDRQLGKLLRAIFVYEIDRVEPTDLEPVLSMAFNFIKSDLARNQASYDSLCERNKANGAKGGRPRKSADENTVELADGEEPEKPKTQWVFSESAENQDAQPSAENPKTQMVFSETQKTQRNPLGVDNDDDNDESIKREKKERKTSRSFEEREIGFFDTLAKSEIWLAQVEERFHLPRGDAVRRLALFQTDCRLKGKWHSSLADCRSHFFDLLKIQLKDEKSYADKAKKDADRRPVEVSAPSAKSYSGKF